MGKLYICATPIGNLDDASFRLVKTLSQVDLIACEDTRRTYKLLQHFGIDKPTISYFQHNQRQREDYLIEQLKSGKDIALVSDAGTPCISDPGYLLVARVWQEGIPVEVIPGPTALIAALVLSGFDTRSFVFEGFLPSRRGQRRKKLQALAGEPRTIILYEAPHRLVALLEDIGSEMNDREVAVVREITKIHEEVKRGRASEVEEYFTVNAPRGEITVIIAGCQEPVEGKKSIDEIAQEVLGLIANGVEKKEALATKALEYKVNKREIYNRIVEISKFNPQL